MPRMDPYGPGGTQASPTPSSGSGLSVPVQSSSTTGGTAPQNPDALKAGFESVAIAKLKKMAGTQGYLLDSTALTSIADRLWQSVSLQQIYASYTMPGQASNWAATLDAAIMNTVLNPSADPTIDPTIMPDYASTLQAAGLSLTPAMLQALSNSTMASNATVPRPFDTSTVSGYDYGQALPADLAKFTGLQYHEGIDYGTPNGSRIVSPFAGTVNVMAADDPQAKYYGQRVTVTLDNGWKMSFGHVGAYEVQNGARVNPGDLLALSGQNQGDSSGAVTLVEWQDPSGKFMNPHDVIDPIFSGSTFQNLGVPGAAGTGMPSVNTILDREYPSVKTDWTNLFGTPPSPEDVYNVTQHGSSPTEWRDYMRSLPGHIDGMTVGQISDLRGTVDSVSQNALGHGGTDLIVKELHDQGMTGQKQVQLWYNEHSPTQLDDQTYNAIYKANQPTMTNILNESGFDPRIAAAQAQTAKQTDPGARPGGHGTQTV
jgi:murein DD-endopeptidase MepM/ murein hydrolase activator NlpD